MNTAKTNLYLTYFFIVFLSLIFFNKISYTKDIPIIVITAGKSAQSYSTVGSSVITELPTVLYD